MQKMLSIFPAMTVIFNNSCTSTSTEFLKLMTFVNCSFSSNSIFKHNSLVAVQKFYTQQHQHYYIIVKEVTSPDLNTCRKPSRCFRQTLPSSSYILTSTVRQFVFLHSFPPERNTLHLLSSLKTTLEQFFDHKTCLLDALFFLLMIGFFCRNLA